MSHRTPEQIRHKIRSLDYSHPWTTDVEHIIEIFDKALSCGGKTALEIGSFRGHATYAIAASGLSLTSFDLDRQYEKERMMLLQEYEVRWNLKSGQESLKDGNRYDFIFHDSDHGNHMIPELAGFFKLKLTEKGIMMVHDVDALNITSLLKEMGNPDYKETVDGRRRKMGTFYK